MTKSADHEHEETEFRVVDKQESTKDRTNDFVKTGTDALVELLGGVADAFGGAVRKAGAEIAKEDVTRLSARNGLLRGSVEGTAHFLDQMPDVLRSTYKVLTSADEGK